MPKLFKNNSRRLELKKFLMKVDFSIFKYFIIILGVSVMMIECSKTGNAKDRPAYNAGMFYPKNPQELSQTVQNYLNNSEIDQISGKPFGLIAPHAGYPYSGPVAAYGYAQLKGRSYDAVIVISPCHVDYFPFASIYSGDSYTTPLGKLSVDKAIAKELVTTNKYILLSTKGHDIGQTGRAEHSLEVQLPFIQETLGDVPIVPIVLGNMDWAVIQTLGDQIGKVAKAHDLLVIASSDLSHFHNYKDCRDIDLKFINILKSFSIEELYQGMVTRKVEACGGGPIIALMLAAKMNDATNIETLRYANSGDVPFGDLSRVVGYLSAAFYKEPKAKKKDPSMGTTGNQNRDLTRDEQLFLIQLAEDVIHAAVKNKPIPVPQDIPAICKEKRGAFVTVEKHHNLRGCIGYILPVYPLYQTVIEVAQSAALKDPRFNPVSPKELNDLEIEVSVLTVPERITDPSVIEVGKHGIIMKRDYYQGLLLPQVATEYGWDRETFLEHTCQKAGLPPDAWKDKATEISIFSAQVFNRKTLK